MKGIYILLAIFLSLPTFAHKRDALCSHARDPLAMARTTIADLGELDYDIKHVLLNLNLTNTAITVGGSVTTTAVVTATSMSTYVFELNDTLTIDSLKINGVLQTVSTVHPSTRKVMLGTALPNASVFTAQVFYHGTSPAGSGLFTRGMVQGTSSTGTQVTYTCGDPNWCSDWWPCKQVLGDKIDSVDMIVTVPAGAVVASNGLLLSTAAVSGGLQYHWKTRYLIDYYLVSVNVAPYVIYNSYIHYSSSTDSTLFQNFFYDTATFISAYKKNFDSAALCIDYFSQLFGRYPFDKEKFGYSYSTLNGGMENQTLVNIGTPNTTIISHELTHQWFGDNVTYASWRDIWLSEGLASYGEQLFIEHFWGSAAMINYRTVRNNAVVAVPNGSLYVDDTTNVARIFDGRLTYYKGAAVAHMLRYVAPNDAIYFQMLRNYQSTYAFGLATTENLKTIAAAAYGKNMDTFFNQWVYQQGHPIYNVKWNWRDSVAYVELTQTTSDASVALFYTPIDIQLIAGSADTIIKVYNDEPVQLFSFSWNRVMTNMKIDPKSNVLHKMGPFGGIKHDTTVGITEPVVENSIEVYPNPAKDEWHIKGITAGLPVTLTDLDGRILWKGVSVDKEMSIPVKELVQGIYIIKISGESIRVTRW